MPTNKSDTLLTVTIDTRDKLKAQAKKEGRTIKGLLTIIIENYIKKAK